MGRVHFVPQAFKCLWKGTPLTSPVSDCEVSWNVTDHNCGSGIEGGPGWQVSHNVANNNGYGGPQGTKGNGISLVGNDATIDSNVANGNGGNGLAGSPGNAILVTNNSRTTTRRGDSSSILARIVAIQTTSSAGTWALRYRGARR